jgi:hypothetical protein
MGGVPFPRHNLIVSEKTSRNTLLLTTMAGELRQRRLKTDDSPGTPPVDREESKMSSVSEVSDATPIPKVTRKTILDSKDQSKSNSEPKKAMTKEQITKDESKFKKIYRRVVYGACMFGFFCSTVRDSLSCSCSSTFEHSSLTLIYPLGLHGPFLYLRSCRLD